MGLRSEIKSILTQVLQTEPATYIINRVADVFAPVTKELQTLEEVNLRLPDSIGMQEAPAASVISMFVQTFGKLAMYPIPFAARKKFRDVYGRGYDDLLTDSDGKTFPNTGEIVPWNSEVGCFLRFSVWNAQAVAASALTVDELRIELLEKELEWNQERRRDAEDRLTDYLAQENETDDAAPDIAAPRHTATQAAVLNLLVGSEDKAQELERKPYEYLIAQLRDEGRISESLEVLWQRQLDQIREAFDLASFLTIGAIHRKTGLSRDAIEPLVQGRASTKVHVNTVVRVSAVLGVPLAGITDGDGEPVPSPAAPTVSRRRRRRLH